MNRFFRQMRKDLLKEKKRRKYLKYAIGEIFLVVIGILIALQINNWNEERKLRKIEKTLLTNIQEDILLDTLDLDYNIKAHERMLKQENLLLNLMLSKNTGIADSINYEDALGYPLVSIIHKSSFHNMQNNFVGLVNNNNSLKKLISRHYDFFYNAIEMLENKSESHDFYEKKLPYFRKYFNVIDEENVFKLNPDSDDYVQGEYIRRTIIPTNIDNLMNDESFKFELSEIILQRNIIIGLYRDIIAKVKIINTKIDNELTSTK